MAVIPSWFATGFYLLKKTNNVHISLRNRQALYKTEGNDVLTWI